MKIFETYSIELLNTWIFVIPVWLLGVFIGIINKKGFNRATDMSWYTLKDKISSFIKYQCAACCDCAHIPSHF